jgi:MFS family permease
MTRSPKPLYTLSFLTSLVFYAPVALYLRTSRGIDVNQFFLLQLILQVVIFFGEVPFGLVTDKIGYKKSILLATFLMSLARLLFLPANGMIWFVAEAVLEGIATCFASGTISALIYEGFEQQQYKKISAINGNFSALGFIVSTALFYLLYDRVHLNGLLILTIVSTVIGVIVACFVPDVSAHHAKTERPSFNFSILKSRQFIRLSAASSLMTLASILINFFFVEKLAAIQVDVKYVALVFLAGEAAGLLTPYLLEWLAAYQDKHIWQVVFLLIGGAFIGLYALSNQVVSLLLMVLLQLLSYLPIYIFSELQNQSITESGNAQHRAAMLSMYNMGNNVIVLAGLVAFSVIKISNPLISFAMIGCAFILFTVLNLKQDD